MKIIFRIDKLVSKYALPHQEVKIAEIDNVIHCEESIAHIVLRWTRPRRWTCTSMLWPRWDSMFGFVDAGRLFFCYSILYTLCYLFWSMWHLFEPRLLESTLGSKVNKKIEKVYVPIVQVGTTLINFKSKKSRKKWFKKKEKKSLDQMFELGLTWFL